MIGIEAIPEELRALPQWVVWVAPSKIPHSPTTLTPASSTDRSTWGSYDQAMTAYTSNPERFAGIGFCFSPDDPYCGVDMDDCLDKEGVPFPRAWGMVEKLGSYTEVSPSGSGMKVILRARKPGDKCKAPMEWEPGKLGQIEIYDKSRYFTITGSVVPDTAYQINDRQMELNRLYNWLFPTKKAEVFNSQTGIMERCRKYLEKCPDSVSGQGGHDKALRAACECIRFGLSDSETLDIMRWWSEAKSGGEPWNEREIQHKIKSARDKCVTMGEVGIRLRNTNWRESSPVKIEAPPAEGATASLREQLGRITSGEYSAAPWKWPVMTRLTQSLLPGSIAILCGTPGSGKTFFLLDAGLGWLELGVPFAMFQLEEDRNYYLRRVLALADECADMTELRWIKANPLRVESATNKHTKILDAMGKAIYDAPEQRVTLTDLGDWYEAVSKSVRVAVIDPVTAASTSERRWVDDGAFIERVKTIARRSETSLVLVTHPKLGKRRGAPTLDDFAGGADFGRFSQSAFVLHRYEGEPLRVGADGSGFGTKTESPTRLLKLEKTRNGRGDGYEIAFDFNPRTLAFREMGVVVR